MDRESPTDSVEGRSGLRSWFTIDVRIVTDFIESDVVLARMNFDFGRDDIVSHLSDDVFIRMLEVAGYASR